MDSVVNKVVIKAVQLEGFVHHGDGTVSGQWLESFDAEANDGWGDAVFTDDITKAMKFPSMNEAFELWKTTSKTRPKRPDGKPNRPLTAFTITFESVQEPL